MQNAPAPININELTLNRLGIFRKDEMPINPQRIINYRWDTENPLINKNSQCAIIRNIRENLKDKGYDIPASYIMNGYNLYLTRLIESVIEMKNIASERKFAFIQKLTMVITYISQNSLSDMGENPDFILERIEEVFSYDPEDFTQGIRIDTLPLFSSKFNEKIVDQIARNINDDLELETGYFRKLIYIQDDNKNCAIRDNCKTCKQPILCPNIPVKGDICCSDHKPLLTNKDREEKFYSSSSSSSHEDNHHNEKAPTNTTTTTTTDATATNNELFGFPIEISKHCKYINPSGTVCKQLAIAESDFCKKCVTKDAIEMLIDKTKKYCTAIMIRGPNKGYACGKQILENGSCEKHQPKSIAPTIRTCPHVISSSQNEIRICGNIIHKSSELKCGIHVNCMSDGLIFKDKVSKRGRKKFVDPEDPEGKIGMCGYVIPGTLKVCNSKGIYYGKCLKHFKILTKPEFRRCEARYLSSGNQCKKGAACDSDYCVAHEEYVLTVITKCRAYTAGKQSKRCNAKCKNSETCGRHKNYKGPLAGIDDDNTESACESSVHEKEIPVDNIKNTKNTNMMNISFTAEDSACTITEVMTPKSIMTMKVVDPEILAVIKHTGWTYDQIMKMKSKKLYKSIVDKKTKKFDLEGSIDNAQRSLNDHYREINGKTQIDYGGAKNTFTNIIDATYSDMFASVGSVIAFCGGQIFQNRNKLLSDLKTKLKTLQKIENQHSEELGGLPKSTSGKKETFNFKDCAKYIATFEDAIETITRHQKEDLHFLKEYRKFMDTNPKVPLSMEKQKMKSEMFRAQCKEYFTKYIIRFAKVTLATGRGKLLGFADFFIDLLHNSPVDFEEFRKVYGGELKITSTGTTFKKNLGEMISNILESNKDTATMEFLDIDITFSRDRSVSEMSLSQSIEYNRFLKVAGIEHRSISRSKSSDVSMENNSDAENFVSTKPRGYLSHYALQQIAIEKDEMARDIHQKNKFPQVAW